LNARQKRWDEQRGAGCRESGAQTSVFFRQSAIAAISFQRLRGRQIFVDQPGHSLRPCDNHDEINVSIDLADIKDARRYRAIVDRLHSTQYIVHVEGQLKSGFQSLT
jgi:hypothetical protein